MTRSSSTMKRAVQGMGLLALFVLLTQGVAAQAMWVQRYPSTAPGAREEAVMAYDPVRSRTVLFGGYAGNDLFGDTWEWDGGDWVEHSPATVPPRRYGAAMAYSGAGVLLFGGNGAGPGNDILGDVWLWDGNQWIPRAPGPSPRVRPAMAYDPDRDRVVLFGGNAPGNDLNDTWEWDGNFWTRLQPSASPPPGGHAMAYDPVRKTTLLFERTTAQTWEWDGQSWTRRFPLQSPSPNGYVTMTFHAGIGKTVLLATDTGRSETWEWNGSNWKWNSLATIHRNRSPASAYDSGRQRTVTFGGSQNPQLGAETWEYVAGTPASFHNFGSGCAGSAGTPELRPVSGQLPKLGHAYGMQMSNLPADPVAKAFVIVGFSKTDLASAPSVSLPFALDALGLVGCTLFVSDDVALPVQKFGTTATWSIPIPNQPQLAGLIVYFQGMAFDPAGTSWATLSDAGEAVLGNH